MEHQPRSLTKSCFQYPFKFPHHRNMFKSKTSQKKPKLQQLEAMDDQTISLVLHGCTLARDLESNLPNLANQSNLLSNSIDEIIKVFSAARTRVYDHDHPSSISSYLHSMLALEQQQIGTSHVQDWLRSNPQAMDIIQTQLVADQREAKSGGNIDVRHSEDEVRGVQGMDIASASGMNTDSSSQRPRRRKDQGLMSKMTVPAPRIGNTEIPPEDGYTWRKYGQKEIMGCRFPRGYYRCTHQKMYSCPAKKQVQRLDHDPLTFEVMYRGEHTCHMSATAPSIPPPPPSDHHIAGENMAQTTSLATSPPTTTLWLSMDLNPIGGGGSSSSGMMGGGRGDGVGTSTTTRYGKEVDFPVVDLADAMFNSGSSSSTSMDFIFHSAENKWEPEDKKN